MAAPVIIAGAGPCGLVAALTLQRHRNVPFVVVERADRSKLLADVGSGYDLSGTTLRIMRHLGLDVGDDFSKRYNGLVQLRLDTCADIRMMGLVDVPEAAGMEFCSAPRSDIQRLLLGALDDSIDLRCGAGVVGFRETSDGVVVSLSDGSEVRGCALLACDGVKSNVRATLYAGVADKLTYMGIDVWWGRAPFTVGSRLDELVRATQRTMGGKCVVQYLGTGHAPGSCFLVPHGDVIVWVFSLAMPAAAASSCSGGCMAFVRPSKPGTATPLAASRDDDEDLTRRGGHSGAETKAQLASLIGASSNYRQNELLRLCVEATPPEKVTRVGLFDRGEGLDLPFVSSGGRVALLGDAAHPQSPFLGQGCNSAVADAFVCATRLACQPSAIDALRGYASEERRRSIRAVVLEARRYAHMFTARSGIMCMLVNALAGWAPPSMIVGDIISKDTTNKVFVEAMLSELGLQM